MMNPPLTPRTGVRRDLCLMRIALVGLIVWGAAAARGEDLSGLDRGHRILIERGFQLQATTFGTEDPNWWTNGDANGTYWEQSNFTTPHFWVRTPAQQNINTGDPWASALTNLGSHVRHREGLVSWQWRDEEDLDDPAIRAWVKGWFELERPRLPNTLLYTNEGPLQVSDANMRLYMTESQPDMLHLDEYPFRDDTYFNGSPWTLYFQLTRYRELALGGHDGTGTTPIPYGTYVQTFIKTPTGDWWHPSESEARMNQFTAWTMGYKMINTWTFDDTPEGPNVLDSIFFDGPDETTTNPTPEFYWYAELNRQALNLGDSLVRLLSTDLRIVQGEKWPGIFWPDWMDEWDASADPYITSISAQNLGTANDGDTGDVLVGYFEPLLEQFDGPVFEDQTYFMITNGLHDPNTSAADATQRITVDLDFGGSGITSLLKLSRDTGLAEVVALQALGGSQYRLVYDAEGGTGDLFKFANGAAFVPGSIPGDVNWDGLVDIGDLALIGSQWGTAGLAPFGADLAPHLAPDGVIDIGDMAVVGSNWSGGQGTSVGGGGASVPLPGAGMGLLMGAVACRRRRRW